MSESSRDQQVQAILHSYLQAVDAGQTPDREEILGQHPAFAEELREFFADQAKMDRLAHSLHRGHALASEITLGADDPNSAAVPQKLKYFGDYESEEEIARGAMGVVFKARQVSLNRPVALKMILKGEFSRENWRTRPTCSAFAMKRRRLPISIIRTSCRFTRSAPTKDSNTSA
jgi:hypothetical protein